MKCKGDARFSRVLCAAFAAVLATAGMAGDARAQSAFDPVVTQVAIGSSSACAVTATGGVKCWGAGGFGQLGGNSTALRSTPFDVTGLAGTAVSVRVGAHHACALMVTGGVKCWGANDHGQLGNNDATHTNSLVPVTVVDAGNQPIVGVAAIVAGEDHACALTTTGTVNCWGANYYGQLGGGGSYDDSNVPVAVVDGTEAPITNVVSLVAGGYHNCALTLFGPTQCWGNNINGQLGNSPDLVGPVSNFAVPLVDASVRALTGVTLAPGAFHTCALGAASGAKCWGFNGLGELGNNLYSSEPNPDPSPVVDASNVPLTGFAEMALGWQHTCARTVGASMKCWGYNGYGELGRGPDFYDKTPQAVVTSGNVPISGVAAIAAGGYNTCAMTAFGGVRCWGDNRFGKDGNGIATGAPAAVTSLGAGTKSVATGYTHTCALTTSGGVLCWGENSSGELGNHSTTSSFEPVAVTGLGSGVLAVAAGNSSTCALTMTGAVMCWGDNSFGKLGNNSPATVFSDTPVAVVDAGNVPLSGATAIAVGRSHACALIAGGVKCWGVNYSGQLGNNDYSLPQAFAGSVVEAGNVPITGIAALAAGANHTCVVTASGGARCWGDNYLGTLGNNDLSVVASSIPLTVVDASNVPVTGMASIAAGVNFNCATTTTHGVKCWGSGGSGQLGGGAFASASTPADVVDSSLTPITGISSVTAGAEHACATTLVGGAVECWGFNFYGELANPEDGQTNVAKPAVDASNSPIVGAAAIAGGDEYTCIVTTGEATQCWGRNANGQLGNRTADTLPAAVVGLSGSAVSITTGDSHTCARTPAGTVRCWGSNAYGQLGNNDNAGANKPTPVTVVDAGNEAALGLTDVVAGAAHTCALLPGGGVACWGANGFGQLGNNDSSGTKKVTPVAVVDGGNVPIAGIAAVTAGAFHTCALTGAGRVLCWGDNSNGQLGNNDSSLVNKYTAASVVDATNTPITGVTAIASGGYFTCALFGGGAVKCWGDNLKAQLGIGTTGGQSLIPVAVSTLGSGVDSIAAGSFHACAVLAGAAKCWGYNSNGQLGDNSPTTRPTPVAVSVPGGVAKISAGQFHTCAVTPAGAPSCWGDNSKGQLGINSIGGVSQVPGPVYGLGSGIAAVAAGGLHTCALTVSGAITCWGNNNAGQVGDNSTTTRAAPVGVLNGQSIAFAPPAKAALGMLTLSATATSGLPTTFDTWTPSICTVSGNKVTIGTYGLCGVRAAQAGNGGTIAAAPSQSRLIVVSNEIFGNGFE